MLKSGKKAEISWISPSISLRPSKNILKKLKFFQNKNKNQTGISNNNKDRQLYAQVLFPNVEEILKIKENFSNIFSKN